MVVHALTPILNVSDIAASFAWFEKLGWRKCWDWCDPDRPGSPPTFGAVGCGKMEIFLCVEGQGAKGTAVKSTEHGEGGGVWMSWWLDSPAAVDAAYELAVWQGMTITHSPTNESWGVREFHLRHPDGHTFRVGAGLEEEKLGQ